METHNIPPLYNQNSKVLILGSFPSVMSRKTEFFYGHPQNRFWSVISAVLDSPIPQTIEQKQNLMLKNSIALWDVIQSCEIVGSSDSSIKNVKPNDIAGLISKTKISRIFTNGKTAEKYYNKFILPTIKISAITLPSTSPANAAYTQARLIDAWSQIIR